MIKNLIEKLDRVLKFSKENFTVSKIVNSDIEVEYVALEVGAEVTASSSEGSVTAIDGEYELENGDKFLVKDGVITEVLSTEEASEEMENEETSDEVSEGLETEVEDLKTEVEELKTELEELKEVLPTLEDLENFKKNFLKELKKTPAKVFSAEVVEEKNDKWSNLARKYK